MYYRPLLKTCDNLLVMGLLTDDDLHQVLYLIDPETFDESHDPSKCPFNSWASMLANMSMALEIG